MNLKTYKNNPASQNIYLYFDDETKDGIIVDAGTTQADEADLHSYVQQNGIKVHAILLTHGHYDHLLGLGRLRKLLDAPAYCHEIEQKMLGDPTLNLGSDVKEKADKIVKDGEILTFGGLKLTAIHTPGHTAGGVCYFDKANEVIFTGDTMFFGDIGRTDLPTSDHSTLISSIKDKLLTLPEETKVYPGHGAPTQIAQEKTSYLAYV
ncbi:MAG: MBL fold metallo-hydrolase [Turicibacter sp.]|nr:MBL fold metallo-hydrolase [Turicibacter sp.]